NPFNPNTSIRFEIPSVTHAKLTVYNALGEEVDVILNETISGGIYQLSWDGSGFASGIYYYRLTAGGFTQTKKMMLIK
ncbi:MAG TPA: T9SS type A sorting domain-containing protein, partial [Ignavibacteria bacterium]|nr:T9SS type A sorting domain-containing protein [Ignavibacteria bacterium]